MLSVSGLKKSFGALEVTRDVSFEVPQGRRHAIIGPNGAGKTTLFNLIAGEIKPDSGSIRIAGVEANHLPPNRRARLGLTRSWQKNNLFPKLTVRQNLLLADIGARSYGNRFWQSLKGRRDAHERAEAEAARVGLAEMLETQVDSLSYGAQRQLEIGLALMGNPKILLLDEPTSGMSPEETGRMLDLVDALPKDLAVLLIEHDMDLVFAHAERITVLNYGQVLLEGTPDEVRGSEVVQETYLGGGDA